MSKRFAVLGDPIAHSLSPRMHTAAYRALGLAHRYEAVQVSPAALPDRIAALRDGAFDGCNVTLPHKRAVLELVDRVAPSAARCGAANTLVRAPDGTLVAHNTDMPALAAEIQELGLRAWAGSTVVVLGSGGAARAAIAALCMLRVGCIVVRARTSPDWLRPQQTGLPQGTTLVAEPFAPGSTERRTALVIQATSLGLPGSQGELAAEAVAWHDLPPTAAALDLVYAPAVTPFLAAARQARKKSQNGLGMLARQGALAFEAWLGIPAPLYTMWRALS